MDSAHLALLAIAALLAVGGTLHLFFDTWVRATAYRVQVLCPNKNDLRDVVFDRDPAAHKLVRVCKCSSFRDGTPQCNQACVEDLGHGVILIKPSGSSAPTPVAESAPAEPAPQVT